MNTFSVKKLLKFADEEERKGFYDCRHLATDSLRAIAQVIDEYVSKANELLGIDECGDCVKCEKNDGDDGCKFFGEPDGCNNRLARELITKTGFKLL